MRFLIVSKPKYPVPPDMASALNDAMAAWVTENTSNGAIEQAWAFAGLGGGGGIANVNSFEELDALMMSYPFGQVSENEIFALSDLGARLERFKAFFAAMDGG